MQQRESGSLLQGKWLAQIQRVKGRGCLCPEQGAGEGAEVWRGPEGPHRRHPGARSRAPWGKGSGEGRIPGRGAARRGDG